MFELRGILWVNGRKSFLKGVVIMMTYNGVDYLIASCLVFDTYLVTTNIYIYLRILAIETLYQPSRDVMLNLDLTSSNSLR
jgi:hypothetical protein